MEVELYGASCLINESMTPVGRVIPSFCPASEEHLMQARGWSWRHYAERPALPGNPTQAGLHAGKELESIEMYEWGDGVVENGIHATEPWKPEYKRELKYRDVRGYQVRDRQASSRN